jgi:hypothetical protein
MDDDRSNEEPHSAPDETLAPANMGSTMPYVVVGVFGLAALILLARAGGSLTVTSGGLIMTVNPPPL